MAFISNKERTKTSAKLYRGNGFRKFFILVSLICAVLCSVMVLLGLLSDLGIKDDFGSISLTKHNSEDKIVLTTYGIVVAVITCFACLGGVISIILALTMRSSKSVTKDVYKLTSSALPGKKTTGHTSRDAKSRM